MSQTITFKNIKTSQQVNLSQGNEMVSKATGKTYQRFYLNGILDPSSNPEHVEAIKALNSYVASEGGEVTKYLLSKRMSYKKGDDFKKILDMEGNPQLVEHPTEVAITFQNFKAPDVTGLEEGSDLENIVLPSHSTINVTGAIEVKEVNGKKYVNLYMNSIEVVKRGEPLTKARGSLIKS